MFSDEIWLLLYASIYFLSSEVKIEHLYEISPGICLEGMMLKLKLQYFGHLM